MQVCGSKPAGRAAAWAPFGLFPALGRWRWERLPRAVCSLRCSWADGRSAAHPHCSLGSTTSITPSLPPGPTNFERCVAAGQAAWLLRQLRGRHLPAAASAALPLLLAALEDPFPHAQACVLCALQHLGAEGQAEDLRCI